MDISAQEKIYLLKLTRKTIAEKLNIDFAELVESKSDLLFSKSGAFVTLHIEDQLRGCIGYIISDQPLGQTIKDAAIQAAFHDPRFSPLKKSEFENIHIEISVLSEPFPMNSYDEIVVGEHGLIVSEGMNRGLLLPQVPIDHNMNKEEYLSALCQKAGLAPFYWKEKTLNIEMFTADVFSEKELGLK